MHRQSFSETAIGFDPVRFNVGLVADVDAVRVAKAVEFWGVGIVRGSDGVEIISS